MGLFVLFLAILPVIIICIYTYKKDRGKEPIGLLIKLFLSGILSCFMVFFIDDLLGWLPFFNISENAGFFELFFYTFFSIALVEEGCKFFMSYVHGYKSGEFDELYDIILYCIMVSCGFAAFENILYLFGNYEDAISIGIQRGILSVPGHAFFALYMGYYLSLAKLASLKGNKKLEKRNIVLSIIIPTILHGIFDFCAFSGSILFLGLFYLFVGSLYIISIKRLNFVAKNNQSLFSRPMINNFCTHCGSAVNGNFCTRCGSRQN